MRTVWFVYINLIMFLSLQSQPLERPTLHGIFPEQFVQPKENRIGERSTKYISLMDLGRNVY